MSNVTTTCRDVSELAPNAQLAIRAFFYECHKQGVHIFVTETYRSQERQNYLYSQGRTKPGQIVTWTLTSQHKSRLAWDIAVCAPNSLYDTKVIDKAGAIAKKLGITWGGSWNGPLDKPHFEVKSTWTLPKEYDVKVINGVKVPSTSSGKVVLTVSDTTNKVPLDTKLRSDNGALIEFDEEDGSKTWRVQSGGYKSKEEAIAAAKKSGFLYNTVQGRK